MPSASMARDNPWDGADGKERICLRGKRPSDQSNHRKQLARRTSPPRPEGPQSHSHAQRPRDRMRLRTSNLPNCNRLARTADTALAGRPRTKGHRLTHNGNTPYPRSCRPCYRQIPRRRNRRIVMCMQQDRGLPPKEPLIDAGQMYVP